jgi:MbtH protein
MSEPSDIYYVVINHEQQYSIWPTSTPPAGWTIVGPGGSREECLDRIEQLWTDMRPLSLREFMAANPDGGLIAETEAPFDEGPDLVSRLCSEQEIELELFGAPSLGLLRERIEHGVVHVRFPGTRGGTLVAVELEGDSKGRAAMLDGARELELSGSLQLDFVDLRLRARVAVETLRGRGQLIRR